MCVRERGFSFALGQSITVPFHFLRGEVPLIDLLYCVCVRASLCPLSHCIVCDHTTTMSWLWLVFVYSGDPSLTLTFM